MKALHWSRIKNNQLLEEPKSAAAVANLFRGTTMFQEFKAFAMRGNVVDMVVGIIIGGAFGRIVSSFVNDVIMPPIGLMLGDMDFPNLYVNLGS
jgi:hypothetical protein